MNTHMMLLCCDVSGSPVYPVYLGVTKEAFANGNVQWFSMPDLCNGVEFIFSD